MFKALRMALGMLVVCAGWQTKTAVGDVYYSAAGTNSKGWKTGAWVWTDSAGAVAEVTPAENDGHTWVLKNAAKLSGATTLPDTTWYWGSDGREGWPAKGIYKQSCNALTNTVPNCTVYGCQFYLNGDGTLYLGGNFTFVNVGQEFQFYCSAASRHFTFLDSFKAVADSDVTIKVPTVNTTLSRFTVNGDWSAYKGNLLLALTNKSGEGTNELRLVSASALGDRISPRRDAIELRNWCKLVMGADVEQSADRGITFNLKTSETAYVGTMGAASDVSTITTPLYGSVGRLMKVDPGTVVLDGLVEMKTLVVSEGVLQLGEHASLPADATIAVEAGAELRCAPNQVGRYAVSGEGLVSVLPAEIPYTPATEETAAETTPVTLAAGYDPAGTVMGVRLSQAIPLPLNETNRLAVVRIPNGQVAVSAFTNLTEKVNGLPQTWLETETDGEGVQTIYLVARPALALTTANKVSGPDHAVWSDGLGIHAGADYFHFNGYGYNGNFRTGSGSNGTDYDLSRAETLSFSGRVLENYMRLFKVGHLRMCGNSSMRLIYANSENAGRMYRHVEGDIYVDESTTADRPFSIFAGTGTTTYTNNDVRATIRGPGYLRVYSENSGATLEVPSVVNFTGDNSGFTGRFHIAGRISDATHNPILVAITNATALGGSPAEPAAAAIYVDSPNTTNAILRADASMMFTDPNRGWTVRRGRLRTPDGVTLSIASPLTVDAAMVKDGPGTLGLGCVAAATSSSATLLVEEGYVMPQKADCCAALNVAFADGAGIAIDAACTDEEVVDKGLTAKSLALGETLRVAMQNVSDDQRTVCRAILTVPAETDDLTEKIVLTGRGSKTLSKQTDEQTQKTTYFATYSSQGLYLIIK